MKRFSMIIVSIMLLLSSTYIVDSDGLKENETSYFLTNLVIDPEGRLTPIDTGWFSENVTTGLGFGILPPLPTIWTEIGTWSTDQIIDDMYIASDITCTLVLSGEKEMTVDLRVSLSINGENVGGTVLEDQTITDGTKSFQVTVETQGMEVVDGRTISMKWEVQGLSAGMIYHGGTGMTSGISFLCIPVYLKDAYYRTGSEQLVLEFVDRFAVFLSDLTITVELDGVEMVQTSMDIEYGVIEMIIDGPLSSGDHDIFWIATYSGGMSTIGTAILVVDDPDNPPVDDDDTPVDDDDPPVDDDDEPLTWTKEQCERSYIDASGDDVTYWSTLDNSLESDSGVELDQNSRLDIRKVEVFKEEESLVVEIDMRSIPEYGITNTGVYNVYLYFLDRDSGHTQPPLDLGRDPDLTKEDYQPSSALATTSIFHSGSYWMCEEEVRGSSYFIKGSISSLIYSGVDPDFELFVKVEYIDLENFVTEDSLNVRITTDYAGFGAWEVDSSLLYIEGSDQSLGIFGSGNMLIYGASIIVIAVLAVAIFIYFVVKKKTRKTVPVYAEYSYVG